MKINKPLIRKMIKRIETMPETYNQERWCLTVGEDDDRPIPACGTAACLAGEAIICAAQSAAKGVARLHSIMSGIGIDPADEAAKLMGVVDSDFYLFSATASGWPQPFRTEFRFAKTYKDEAQAAVNLLKAILRTDGKILTETERR